MRSQPRANLLPLSSIFSFPRRHAPRSRSSTLDAMVKVEIVDEKENDSRSVSSHSRSRSSSVSSQSSVDTHSSIDDDDVPEAESLYERFAALVDIVPPTTRYAIRSNVSKTFSAAKTLSKLAGNVVWIVTTSALLVGLPLALSLEDESKIVAQEKEMMAQQAGQQQVHSISIFTSFSS